jgi:hypothetical protein
VAALPQWPSITRLSIVAFTQAFISITETETGMPACAFTIDLSRIPARVMFDPERIRHWMPLGESM